MRAVAQRAEAGDVVGMQVGVDRFHQLEVELTDELQIAINLLQHRIDDQRLAAAAAGDQVGVGARNTVEKLAKDHHTTPLSRHYSKPAASTSCWLVGVANHTDCTARCPLLAESGRRRGQTDVIFCRRYCGASGK